MDFNIKDCTILKRNQKNKQFIYFSGIGIEKDNDSKRSKAIYESEKYIQKNFKNSVIIRPG